MKIDAIIFDSDGVLVDSEVLGIALERRTLAEIGLDYDIATYQARFLGLPDGDFMAELEQDCRARLGCSLPGDLAARLEALKEVVYPRELIAVPGIAELLAVSRLARAVASSASVRQLERNLRLTGLYDSLAPHIYSADLVAAGKPSPDIYLYAAERLAVAPNRCLVIEDSANGVKAGLAAGMTVWGFIGGGHADAALGARLRAAGAARVLESHRELQDQLEHH